MTNVNNGCKCTEKKFIDILKTKKCKNKAPGLWVTYLRKAERENHKIH